MIRYFIAFVLAFGLITVSASAQTDGGGVLSVGAVVQREPVHPGDTFAIALVLDYAAGWHSWPNKPVVPKGVEGVEAEATTVSVVSVNAGSGGQPMWISVREVWTQWPEPQVVETAGLTGKPLKILSYAGKVVVYVPVTLAHNAAAGDVSIEFKVHYQACNETTCMRPADAHAVAVVHIATMDAESKPIEGELFKSFSASVFSKILAGEVPDDVQSTGALSGEKSSRFDFFGKSFEVRTNAYWLILPIAFVAGFLLNLTPCVLPVIPIKILSLQAQAKSPGKLVFFGVIYCVGIVATFAGLGLLAFGVLTGGRKFDWGQIFTSSWFTIGMAAVVGIMGLGMMGLFNIRLPKKVYALNPSHDSVHGNFLLGVLTAILSTPCTGPLLGATVAWATTQSPATGLVTFLVMGLGMASPYAVLILFPKLIDKLPRSGPGGELLKQVIGILLIAVAVFLASNLTSEKWPWWVVGSLAAIGWLWLVIGGVRMLKTAKSRAVCVILGVACLCITVPVTLALARDGSRLRWEVHISQPDAKIQAAIDEARQNGKVVVVDFTAKWCTNCHIIESTILNSDAGVELLTGGNIKLIKVDITKAADDQGWGLVRKIGGGGGIPLIAVYGPDLAIPIYFQSFFEVSDLEAAVVKAEGPRVRIQ